MEKGGHEGTKVELSTSLSWLVVEEDACIRAERSGLVQLIS